MDTTQQRGNPRTPAQVLHEYAPRVYSLVRRMLGNDADAEDVTQEVFLRVLRNLDTFRGEAAFPTWLHRVAVNAALTYRRQKAVRARHEAEEAVEDLTTENSISGPGRSWSVPPEQQVLDRETQEQIEAAIAGLGEKYRDVYVLSDVEGLPSAEVAALLGLSLPAVKSRLHRARLKMRAALAPYFDQERVTSKTTPVAELGSSPGGNHS